MTAERDYLVRRARERDAFLWTGYNLGGGKCVLHLCSILGDTILCVIARGPSYTRRASILIPFGKNAPVARQLCKLQSLHKFAAKRWQYFRPNRQGSCKSMHSWIRRARAMARFHPPSPHFVQQALRWVKPSAVDSLRGDA